MLTLNEAAASLGVAASTLRHQVRNGKLRATKRGRDLFVTEREVERYQRDSRPARTRCPVGVNGRGAGRRGVTFRCDGAGTIMRPVRTIGGRDTVALVCRRHAATADKGISLYVHAG